MRRTLSLLVLAGAFTLVATPAAACTVAPDPSRWSAPATPDQGRADFVTAAHRGAADLAPENTLDAYAYAIAYGVDLIEVDVQQTLDGRFVSFHDTDVDAKSDGTGRIGLMTYDQARALNVADYGKWKGSAYDPARMPSLEEVLELAQDTKTGVYVDMKESVTNVPAMMRVFERYPAVYERSAFLPYEPGRAAAIRAVSPRAEIMWSNLAPQFPPGYLFVLAATNYKWFGSDLDTYDAGKIAAIHDACGNVIPNAYDGSKADVETRQVLEARAMGADGAQINLPDVTADALDEPVRTRMVRRAGDRACLVDAAHGLPLPRKPLTVGEEAERRTDRHGCVPAAPAASVTFAGDGSALAPDTLG